MRCKARRRAASPISAAKNQWLGAPPPPLLPAEGLSEAPLLLEDEPLELDDEELDEASETFSDELTTWLPEASPITTA